MPFPKTLDDRYHSDETFSVLVDLIESVILHNGYKPEELRDALVLAAVRHYSRNMRPYVVYVDGFGCASFTL